MARGEGGGGHTVGIAVYEFAWEKKKKLNYHRRCSCASYFRSLPIDRALSIFYAMKCPDTNGGAAASAPLAIVRL